ncbi:hypothetical protein [Allorhodopirellula solitaria]|uniref:PEP-CTERM protein-sorting domain-containing protein n=1 Tax=Allorhodopirellula solitaria TaxID=2527987 RepID=A0A5C5XPX3_9BACT|nr:hypothetical protein [Allorhodopirellula solitaria]TWT65276.1 hypothetical protein CA85_31880 [Allorhodopirellula solitaria]
MNIRFVLLVLSICCVSAADGAIIASWDFDGIDMNTGGGIDESTSPFSFTAPTTAPHVSGVLRIGSSLNPSTAGSRYGFKVLVGDSQTSLAGAINAGHFIDFTVTAAQGFQMNLDSLAFVGQTTANGSNSAAVLTSISGFNDGDQIASVDNIAGVTGGLDTDASGFGPISLSMPEFQNLTGPISFRIYGFGTTTGAGDTYLRNLVGDDLVVNGSVVAVPEPSLLLCLLATLCAGFGARRVSNAEFFKRQDIC